MFAVLTAFLLFKKQPDYSDNCKKKFRTLVIPYFFWIILYTIVELIGGRIKPSIFNAASPKSVEDWLSMMIGVPFGTAPSVYTPIWFIRDLILLNLLYPVTRYLIDRVPIATGIGAVLIMFLPIIRARCLIAGFIIGGILGTYPIMLERMKSLLTRRLSCLMIALCCILAWIAPSSIAADNMVKILYMLSLYTICSRWVERKKNSEWIEQFAGMSFIVYILHGKLLSILQIVLTRLIPQYEGVILIEYIVLPFLIVIVCCIFGTIYQKLMPRLFTFSTGGRMYNASRAIAREK